MKMNIAAAALCATVSLPVVAVGPAVPYADTFDNIRYWVGNGTNKCAVVIDFNDDSVPYCSFAWGYRWNGDAPSMKAILDEITANDPRLKMFASSSAYGTFIDAFAYDVDDDGGTFERVWNASTYAYDHVKSDEDDLFPACDCEEEQDRERDKKIDKGCRYKNIQNMESPEEKSEEH